MKNILFAMSLVIFLSACSPVRLPNVDRYAIAMIQPIQVAHYRSSAKTLLVSQPIASPGYDSVGMVYMITPFEISHYSRNQWVAPPANMLMPVFVEALRRSNRFKAVVSPPFVGVTDYRLDTQLLCLQQEFLLPKSQERLTVQATLIDNHNNIVLATKQFNVVVSAPSNNPYSGVLAANAAAKKVAAQLVRFVAVNAG